MPSPFQARPDVRRPSPEGPSDPASEQVRRWIETPVEYWEECQRLYGPVTALDLGSLGSVVLFSNPDDIRAIFRLSRDSYEVRQFNEHYRYVMGDNAILVQDGDTHQRQRRLLAPPFRQDLMLPRAPEIRQIAEGVLAEWPEGAPFNPRPGFHLLIFHVLVKLILGDLDSVTSRSLCATYRDAVLRQVGSWGPWRSFTRMHAPLRELLSREIRARRDDAARPGLLTSFAQSRYADGEPLSETECQDHVFSLMIAGVDTTAISIAWAMHWLCLQPATQERLRADLETLPAGAGDAALLELPFLDAVYRETLRMYPIVPTPSGRKLTREAEIGDYLFPAGATLVPCSYLVHHREEIYPDSRTFHAERFLDRTYGSYEYFPFGGGARVCIGETLTQIEFKTILEMIVRRWSLKTTVDQPLGPVRHGTLLAPPESFEMIVHRRVEH